LLTGFIISPNGTTARLLAVAVAIVHRHSYQRHINSKHTSSHIFGEPSRFVQFAPLSLSYLDDDHTPSHCQPNNTHPVRRQEGGAGIFRTTWEKLVPLRMVFCYGAYATHDTQQHHATIPKPPSSDTLTLSDEQVEVERMLSECLVQGFCLLDQSCPTCNTPLVKQSLWAAEVTEFIPPPQNTMAVVSSSIPTRTSHDPVVPILPVVGVAYCVKCQAHVVSNTAEMEILDDSKDTTGTRTKGSILIPSDSATMDDSIPPQSHDAIAATSAMVVDVPLEMNQSYQLEEIEVMLAGTLDDELEETPYQEADNAEKPESHGDNRATPTWIINSNISEREKETDPSRAQSLEELPRNFECTNLLEACRQNNNPIVRETSRTVNVQEIEWNDCGEEVSLLAADENLLASTRNGSYLEIEKTRSHETTVELAIQRSQSCELPKKVPSALPVDFPMPEFTVRREIAIKVLASKMVQGFSIKEGQCEICFMPHMCNMKGEDVECFVCRSIKKNHYRALAVKAVQNQCSNSDNDTYRQHQPDLIQVRDMTAVPNDDDLNETNASVVDAHSIDVKELIVDPSGTGTICADGQNATPLDSTGTSTENEVAYLTESPIVYITTELNTIEIEQPLNVFNQVYKEALTHETIDMVSTTDTKIDTNLNVFDQVSKEAMTHKNIDAASMTDKNIDTEPNVFDQVCKEALAHETIDVVSTTDKNIDADKMELYDDGSENNSKHDAHDIGGSKEEGFLIATESLESNLATTLGYDSKIDLVRKAMLHRTRIGWQMLDKTCAQCVMPLMTDTLSDREVCVFCELEGTGNITISKQSDLIPQNQDSSDQSPDTRTVTTVTSDLNIPFDDRTKRLNTEVPAREIDSLLISTEKIMENEDFAPKTESALGKTLLEISAPKQLVDDVEAMSVHSRKSVTTYNSSKVDVNTELKSVNIYDATDDIETSMKQSNNEEQVNATESMSTRSQKSAKRENSVVAVTTYMYESLSVSSVKSVKSSRSNRICVSEEDTVPIDTEVLPPPVPVTVPDTEEISDELLCTESSHNVANMNSDPIDAEEKFREIYEKIEVCAATDYDGSMESTTLIAMPWIVPKRDITSTPSVRRSDPPASNDLVATDIFSKYNRCIGPPQGNRFRSEKSPEGYCRTGVRSCSPVRCMSPEIVPMLSVPSNSQENGTMYPMDHYESEFPSSNMIHDVVGVELAEPKASTVHGSDKIIRLTELETDSSHGGEEWYDTTCIDEYGRRVASPGNSVARMPKTLSTPSSVNPSLAGSSRSFSSRSRVSSNGGRIRQPSPEKFGSGTVTGSRNAAATTTSINDYATSASSHQDDLNRSISPGLSEAPIPVIYASSSSVYSNASSRTSTMSVQSSVYSNSSAVRSNGSKHHHHHHRNRVTPETTIRNRKPGLPSYLPGNPERNEKVLGSRPSQYHISSASTAFSKSSSKDRIFAYVDDFSATSHESDRLPKPNVSSSILQKQQKTQLNDIELYQKPSSDSHRSKERRDEAIVVDYPKRNVHERDDFDTDTLDTLLLRIEKAKVQLEHVSTNDSISQYRLRDLVDNLAHAAEQLQHIEQS
jgi:uncharacterized Zn finger protein (UPF0148 family)